MKQYVSVFFRPEMFKIERRIYLGLQNNYLSADMV